MRAAAVVAGSMTPSDATVATASVTSTDGERVVVAGDERRGHQQQHSQQRFDDRHRPVDARALVRRGAAGSRAR